MRNIVYFFVFEGFADWEAALALCEIRRPGDYRLRTVGIDRRPVRSMGGLTVLPDISLDEIDVDGAVLMILPGGTAWERGEIEPVSALLRRLHDSGVTIGALCSGVLALAYAGLLDTRRHAGNYAGHIETYVPDYAGNAHYDADAFAITDDGLITAGGVGCVEFAREVIRALDLYDERDTAMWYRLFKHGVPPPWFAPAETLETEQERA
ncbi:MAG TPA: DJ-1/PfpI family protein [Rhodanobacteraceae bacterium]|jgi:putative intracellular protease/amidase|nr:DJ-1/PfpI family protein [Rhodanobacteraceae bacterium]